MGPSAIVLLPTITCAPSGPRLSRIPKIVTAGPPRISVYPPATYRNTLLAVIISDPTVKASALVGLNVIVLLAITIALAEGVTDTSVPCILTGSAPSVIV